MNHSIGINDERIKRLEKSISILSKRIDDLSIDLHNYKQTISNADSTKNYPYDTHTTYAIASLHSLEGLLERDVLLYASTACFTMVVALVLRIFTENEIIPTGIGIILGLTYCYGLIVWSLLPIAQQHKISLIVGLCGLIVLCLLSFESFVFFNQINLATYFILLVSALLASLAIEGKYQTSVLGWLGVSVTSLLFIIPNYSIANRGWVFIYLIFGSALAFTSQPKLGLRTARTILGFLILTVMFAWTRELNSKFYQSSTLYESLPYISPIIISFAAFYCLPSIISGALGRGLTLFEKLSPNIAVVSCFLFINSEMFRQQALQPNHAMYGLFISIVFIGIGIGYGIRNWPYGYGLRTFLSAGVTLLFLSTSQLLESIASMIALWSICSMLLFGLSIYFKCPDLRLLSFVFHIVVFIIAMASGIFQYNGSGLDYNYWISLLMCMNLMFHYIVSLFFYHKASYQNAETVKQKMRFSIVLIFCALIAFYFWGGNTITNFFGPGPFSISLHSVWFSFIACITLLSGVRSENKEIERLGFVVMAAAAIKVLFVDLLLKTGSYYALGVFAFGVFTLFSSYLIQVRGRLEQ